MRVGGERPRAADARVSRCAGEPVRWCAAVSPRRAASCCVAASICGQKSASSTRVFVTVAAFRPWRSWRRTRHPRHRHTPKARGVGDVDASGAERAGFEPAVAFTTQHFQCCTFNHSDTSPCGASMYEIKFVGLVVLLGGLSSDVLSYVAEREGFEPSVPFPTHQISSLAPSTTRTPLRVPGRARGAECSREIAAALASDVGRRQNAGCAQVPDPGVPGSNAC